MTTNDGLGWARQQTAEVGREDPLDRDSKSIVVRQSVFVNTQKRRTAALIGEAQARMTAKFMTFRKTLQAIGGAGGRF